MILIVLFKYNIYLQTTCPTTIWVFTGALDYYRIPHPRCKLCCTQSLSFKIISLVNPVCFFIKNMEYQATTKIMTQVSTKMNLQHHCLRNKILVGDLPGMILEKKLRSLEFTFPGKNIYSPWKRNLGSSPLVLWFWSCGRVVLWPSGPVVPWQRREKKYVGTKNAWKECKRK